MSEAAIGKAYDATGMFFQNKEERLNYINRQMAIMDYNSGMNAAEKRGEERGEKRGEKRGEARMKKLTQLLLQQNRIEDLNRASTDNTYCEQLYRKYKL